jgi:curli biogenesis system outer membrane secretion channel CsgG
MYYSFGKMLIFLGLLFFSLVALFPDAKANCSTYKDMAIFTFKNNSGNSLYEIEEAVTDMFIAEISKNSLFRIVERQRLKEVVDELKLSMVGILDPETSIEVQKLIGARYLVFGTITRCGYEQNQKSFFVDSVSHKTIVELVVRVVDAETGQTIGGAEGAGMARRGSSKFDPQSIGLQIKLADKKMKPLGGGTTALEQSGLVAEAAYYAVKQLSKGMADVFPLEGYIIKVKGSEVLIDLNGELVNGGMKFEVLRVGEEIFHPITKKRLGQEVKKVGTIKVTETSDRFSYAKIVKGKKEIAVGDKIRMHR